MNAKIERILKHAFVKAIYLVALIPVWLTADLTIFHPHHDAIDHPWIIPVLMGCGYVLMFLGRALEMEMEKYDENY